MNSSVDFGRPKDDPWPTPKLDDRHIEILSLVQDGKNSGEIGMIMGLSGRTIEYHLARAFAALGVHTRIQAVVRARELGLLSPSDRRPPGPRTFSVQRRRTRRRID
jgi:DNA-binding NarL/FixJ family response regulator